ncbi:MAG: SWIM zinc finger family protein [Oligoflexia bacterium]|nr:SWIM zinc finger family protein [Oligoflexia bacterium]
MSWYRRRRSSSRRYYSSYYPPHVSKAEKQELAKKTLTKLKEKNPNLSPVIVNGRTYATTWWGKAWNNNLIRYADFSNRVGRGRAYVSNGAVLDLKIKEGEISSIVQGSSSNPYKIIIKISELKDSIWSNIKKSCSNKLSSLSDLLTGKLPQDVGEIFTAIGDGLFPEPNSMKFSCSCPDGGSMCKHVAATLYGVGNRLDQDPSILFTLRKVNMKELIKETLVGVKDELKKKAENNSVKKSRVISDANVEQLFGIDMAAKNVETKVLANVTEKVKGKKNKGEIKLKTKTEDKIKIKIISKSKVTKDKVKKTITGKSKKKVASTKSSKKVAIVRSKTKKQKNS